MTLTPDVTGLSSRRSRRRRRGEAAPHALGSTKVDWASLDPADLTSPSLYINRELSWLEFNQRVLAQAQDASHPLLERVKFLAIAGSNLDEFFMVRVATILKKFRADIDEVSIDGLNTEQELATIRSARSSRSPSRRNAGRATCVRCSRPRASTSSSRATTRRRSTTG